MNEKNPNNNQAKEVCTKPMCDRVIVNDCGLALRPAEAFYNRLILSEIIFERVDGWTLGAPPEFERVAYAQWSAEWVAFRRFPDYERVLIDKYELPPAKRKK